MILPLTAFGNLIKRSGPSLDEFAETMALLTEKEHAMTSTAANVTARLVVLSPSALSICGEKIIQRHTDAVSAELRDFLKAALSREQESNRDWSTEAKKWMKERAEFRAEIERLEQQLAEAAKKTQGGCMTTQQREELLKLADSANDSAGEPAVVEPPYKCVNCGVGLFESGDLLNGLCLYCQHEATNPDGGGD